MVHNITNKVYKATHLAKSLILVFSIIKYSQFTEQILIFCTPYHKCGHVYQKCKTISNFCLSNLDILPIGLYTTLTNSGDCDVINGFCISTSFSGLCRRKCFRLPSSPPIGRGRKSGSLLEGIRTAISIDHLPS